MNAREAREILDIKEKLGSHDHSLEKVCSDCRKLEKRGHEIEADYEISFHQMCEAAHGFLECVEKMKPIVETLNMTLDCFEAANNTKQLWDAWVDNLGKKVARILASYRRDVLGEEK